MRKYDIPKRTRSDAQYVKQNPNGNPFEIKTQVTSEDAFLLGLGIGIFWGEGNKTNKNSVRIANSDPDVILTFKKFLLQICQLDPKKIRYSIVCFNDSNPNSVGSYWSKLLATPKTNFGKIVQIPSVGKGTYKRKSLYGVCTLTVGNLRLKQWFDHELSLLKSPR